MPLIRYLFKAFFVLNVAFDVSLGSSDSSDSSVVKAMNDYFMKYNAGASIATSSAVASTEDAVLDLSLEDNPIFSENVVKFQRMAHINVTGFVNEETVDKMKQDRCGVFDTEDDPYAPGQYKVQSRWRSKHDKATGLYMVTYSYPKRDTPNDVNFQQFKKSVALAFCSWELISNLRFRYLGVGKSNADVLISYEKRDHSDGYPFDGRGGTLGHAFYPEDGRVHFDNDEKWYIAKEGAENHVKKDVYTVALHEFGHTIGLLHTNKANSLMEPFYHYRGLFGKFDMPKDEIDGVTQMYGNRIDSNPLKEQFSACKYAKRKYKVNIKSPESTGTVATSSTTEAETEPEFEEKPCEDDPFHAKVHCPAWKSRNLCQVDIFSATMHRRCKKTCGFCPNDKKADKLSGLLSSDSSSICDIPYFDSVMTTYDDTNGFSAFIFKDDYYFEMRVALDKKKYSTHSLLNQSDVLTGVYRYDTNPRSITPGLFKIRSPSTFLHKTNKAQASVLVGSTYFTFEEKFMHVYDIDANGVINFQTSHVINELFSGYNAETIDAVHVSVNDSEDTVLFTLFQGSQMWQYKEYRDKGRQNLNFVQIPDKFGVDISQWQGVPACNVDSIFEYRGVPYFLKGNIFWPATDTEPPIARDITYNFFRCWEKEPLDIEIPTDCSVSGNGASSLNLKMTSLFVVLSTLVNLILLR